MKFIRTLDFSNLCIIFRLLDKLDRVVLSDSRAADRLERAIRSRPSVIDRPVRAIIYGYFICCFHVYFFKYMQKSSLPETSLSESSVPVQAVPKEVVITFKLFRTVSFATRYVCLILNSFS